MVSVASNISLAPEVVPVLAKVADASSWIFPPTTFIRSAVSFIQVIVAVFVPVPKLTTVPLKVLVPVDTKLPWNVPVVLALNVKLVFCILAISPAKSSGLPPTL